MSSIKNALFIVLFTSLFLAGYGQNQGLRSPVDFPMHLSGNFGELRGGHFHSGIDIKTYGVKGKKIYAIADGYISRIKISTGGYGKALYVHHPDEGITSVFGHLKSFSKSIEEYILKKQYAQKTFEIQLFPEPDQFPVKKGDLIAFSGNSGSSQGPHIHFEIRNLSDQHPLNPLNYGFQVKDDIPPKIFNLAIYRHNKHGTPQKKGLLETNAISPNVYKLKNNHPIPVQGNYSFGIRAFDFLNGASNWCGLYDLKLFVDSAVIYHHRMDKFYFQETQYIKNIKDLKEKIKNNLSIQRTYIQPNNKLSLYRYVRGKGIISFTDNQTHTLRYQVRDVHGNESTLSFEVKGDSSCCSVDTSTTEYLKKMPYQVANNFSAEEMKVHFPANAFYDTLRFNYNMENSTQDSFFSNIHHIHNKYTPVHKFFTLSIKSRNIDKQLIKKAFIARIEEEDEYQYKGGKELNGYITTKTREFGKYAVMIDTLNPTVKLMGNKEELNNKNRISFHVEDDLSGIDTFNGFIDGSWVLFEYDPKNNLLTHDFSTHKLEAGKVHEIELYVGDKVNNISTFYMEFER